MYVRFKMNDVPNRSYDSNDPASKEMEQVPDKIFPRVDEMTISFRKNVIRFEYRDDAGAQQFGEMELSQIANWDYGNPTDINL